jgi:ribosomal protein S8E
LTRFKIEKVQKKMGASKASGLKTRKKGKHGIEEVQRGIALESSFEIKVENTGGDERHKTSVHEFECSDVVIAHVEQH